MSPRARLTAVALAAALAILGALSFLRKAPAPLGIRIVPHAERLVRKELDLPAPTVPQDPQGAPGTPALYGSVIDDLSEAKVPGVVVHAYSGAAAKERPGLAAEAGSDEGGNYRLFLPAGRYTLRWYLVDTELEPSKVAPLGSLEVVIGPGDAGLRKDLHCELAPKVIVEGVVLDRRNSLPVADAEVLIDRDPEEWQPRFNQKEVYGKLKAFFSVEHLRTGEDGRFRAVALLYPGRYSVIVAHPHYQKYWGDRDRGDFRVLAAQGQHYALTLRMDWEAKSTLKGRLLSRSGQPVAGARVVVRNGSLEKASETDSEGNFTSEVTDEPVTIIARHAEYRTFRRSLKRPGHEGAPEEVTDAGTMILDRKEFHTSVTSVDETGAPVPLDELWVAESDLSTGGEVNPFFSTRTSADGAGGFLTDPGLLYSFHLPGDSAWEILNVAPSPNVALKQGVNYSFAEPESQIRIVVRKRAP